MQYLRFNKNIMEMNRKLLKKVENHKRFRVFFLDFSYRNHFAIN